MSPTILDPHVDVVRSAPVGTPPPAKLVWTVTGDVPGHHPEGAVVDWGSIGETGFVVAERTAASVARAYAGVEEDDVYQECLIYLATHVEEMTRQFLAGYDLPGTAGGEWGGRKAMIRQLSSRMREWAGRQVERRGLEVVAARRQAEKLDTSRWSSQTTPAGFEGLGYTPALIEALLPGVWDMSSITSSTSDSAPDPEMPRASSDPSHAGTHMAHYADIRDAWQHAPLSHLESCVLLLRYGAGLDQAEVGDIVGVTQSTVSRRINAAIEKIAAHLNGKTVSLSGLHDDPDLAA